MMGDAWVHPDLRRVAWMLPKAPINPHTMKLVRAATAVLARRRPPDVLFAQAGGVSLRVHGRPAPGEPRPGLLWLHGGGYVIGSAAMDDQICRSFARRLGIVVAVPEYRLAPEHRFPASLDDCYEALRWLSSQSDVDPTRVAVGGSSAGGGLAAALALRVREERDVVLAFQLLTYPMLDDRTVNRADIDERHVRLWNNKANRLGWESYTGVPAGSDGISALAAPGRCRDYAGLPPAWIGVGTSDLFHGECVAYADELRAAGVACDLEVVGGAFHGFDYVSRSAVVRAFRQAQMTALASALGVEEKEVPNPI
jgi:acetyl esterase/lipase